MNNNEHHAYKRIAAQAARLNPGKQISMELIENVDTALLDAYASGSRVKVERTDSDGEVYSRTGTVSVSLGWTPVLLLIARSNQRGSSDTLSSKDRVTHWRSETSGGYIPVRQWVSA